MKSNYFNLNDLKPLTDIKTARIIVATCKRTIGSKQFMVHVPTKIKGKPTTQLINMNHFDLDEAIEYFSKEHELKSVTSSRQKKLEILKKLKKDK